jgi:uncharacterized protein YndB with AHSA1/START domain
MIEIRVETVIGAEPMAVWDVLADHERMDKWMNFRKVVRSRPGSIEPNGMGAVRTIYASGGRVMQERITKFDPGRCLEYDVLRGAPGWTPRGQITLTPTRDGGTLVCWKVTLHPYIPSLGWLVQAFLKRSLTRALKQLKDRIEPEPLLSLEKESPRADAATVAPKQRRPSLARARATRESVPNV